MEQKIRDSLEPKLQPLMLIAMETVPEIEI